MEKNVAADPRAAQEMVRVSGQRGVPVITIDDQAVVGFNQPRLAQLLKQAKPRLGASIADAASQVRKHPGIPASGAYVGRVRRGSPAEQAGLRAGDVITRLGGQPVVSAADVHRLVPQMPKDRAMSLSFVRNRQEGETSVTF